MSRQHPHRRVVAAAFLMAACAGISLAHAERPPPFSGTTVSRSPELDQEVKGKIELSEDSLRFEVEREGLLTALIAGPHIDGVVMLVPDQELALEMPDPPDGTPEVETIDPNDPCEDHEEMNCSRLGQEELGGRQTQVWEVGQGGESSKIWIDEELRFPLRIEEPGGQTFEIRDIRLGSPPAERFRIPANYERMQMPVDPHHGQEGEGFEGGEDEPYDEPMLDPSEQQEPPSEEL